MERRLLTAFFNNTLFKKLRRFELDFSLQGDSVLYSLSSKLTFKAGGKD